MGSLESFLNNYSGVIMWTSVGLIFLAFTRGFIHIIEGLWKYLKKGKYD